jgi:PAS domain S-box-containing protein
VAGRLAAIVQSSDDAIVSKTLEGVITSWNPAAERIFGWAAAEAIGRHITLIIPDDRRHEEDEVLARVRRGEAVDHFETVRRTKEGTLIDIALTVSPVRDATGRIVGASKIARDITPRKRVEAERAELLARERRARSEAEALNRLKDEFLAVLSHELRTPLSAVYGWARMLADGKVKDPDQVRHALEAILRNSTAQLRLVEDLLDVSRIVTGNMRLEVRPVDVTAVIQAALDAVRPAANAKAIRIQTVLDSRAAPLMGDPARLQQAMWNLLNNAVKFTPKGGRVHLSLQRIDSHVELVVADTGQGIAPDVLPYIFERFTQGDRGQTRQHGGLGIGLALVRHLVELHGGTVTATSPGVGQGATFVVKLPVAIVRLPTPPRPPQLAAPTPPAAPASRVASPSLDGVRVVVVDDDVDGLELVAVILRNRGAAVRTCASVAEARGALAADAADVVVADIEMPGEDGYTLLAHLRAADTVSGHRTPAIALTAYGRADDRKAALAAGFNLHLAKPVDPLELVIAVANQVGRVIGPPAAGGPGDPRTGVV